MQHLAKLHEVALGPCSILSPFPSVVPRPQRDTDSGHTFPYLTLTVLMLPLPSHPGSIPTWFHSVPVSGSAVFDGKWFNWCGGRRSMAMVMPLVSVCMVKLLGGTGYRGHLVLCQRCCVSFGAWPVCRISLLLQPQKM